MMLKDLQAKWRKQADILESGAPDFSDGLAASRDECANDLQSFVEREQEDMELIRKLLQWAETFNPSKTSDHPLAMKARERLKEFGL